MKLSTSLLAVMAPSAMGHYMFWTINKSSNWQYIRETANNPTQAPIEDPSSGLMACYEKPGRAAASVLTVAAGSRVSLGASSAVTHPGPSLFYMARVPDGQDVATWSPSGAVWFKIDQHGANGGGSFQSGMMEIGTTIPASLQSGNYLLRTEHIGLHSAGSPQFYVSCAQLKVTGNGASSPSSLVSFPGAYKMSDPGLSLNIYTGAPASYPYPGPAVWGGGGSSGGGGDNGGGNNGGGNNGGGNNGGGNNGGGTAPTQPSNPQPTQPPSGSCASMYGQCGGQGWTGATCCSSGTCKASNEYYSQCT